MSQAPKDSSEQVRIRREKLAAMREQGFTYPNDFRPSSNTAEILADYADYEQDQLESEGIEVALAGRMMSHRVMGKSSFAHLQDQHGRLQLFLNRDVLGVDVYQASKKWDLGDLIAVSGTLFRTRSGELSLRASSLRLMAKGLRPLPEKWHGLSDQETRYRQRYLDLIVNESSRACFTLRSKIVSSLRRHLEADGFLEVETPMLQVQPGGAAARPFITHHNALNMPLYLRIAPELYLKRLIVGGYERVFEINRNFRNEGSDATHNPEFTMVEWYQAYADVDDAMDRTEALIRQVASDVDRLHITWDEHQLDLSQPFQRLRMDEAVFSKRPDLRPHAQNKAALATVCLQEIPDIKPLQTWKAGHYLAALFEALVETELSAPTFITHYPADISPLARLNDDEPFFTDRFELFIAGKEIANGFSELNDPDDQRKRFEAQVQAQAAGDDEAMASVDEDYLRALEFGMPPTAGVGVGVDRLVMMLTEQHSIRDVLLFPHMRPEAALQGEQHES